MVSVYFFGKGTNSIYIKAITQNLQSSQISIEDLFYANIGDTDKSSDFTKGSTDTITHDNDKYIVTTTGAGYHLLSLIPLNGISLDNCVLEFDVNLRNTNDNGISLQVVSQSKVLRLGLNDTSKLLIHNYGTSNDSYENYSASHLYNTWVHFKYTFQNNNITMEIYLNGILQKTKTLTLNANVLGSTSQYSLLNSWVASTRYIKNITVKKL